MLFRLLIQIGFFIILAMGECDAAIPAVSASPPVIPSSDVLIIHDSLPGPLPPGWVDGNNILDLLGHFGLRGTLQPIENYRAGDLSRFRFVIVLGIDERQVSYPQDFLSDIRNTRLPVFWIANHMDELLKDQQFMVQLGFRMADSPLLAGFQSVIYKGQSLIKGEPSLLPLEILDPSRVQVLATAVRKEGSSMPYMVRSGSFWYCADSPFSYAEEGNRYLVFCDLLHDFFGIQHPEERKALVRIEDVSVDSDTDDLRDLADYLYGNKIPFQVSLIPIFKDPETKEEIYLSDRPQFVRTIHYMVSRGATIVMHGVTHQYHGRSGDDYEFWDDQSGKPVSGDAQAAVEQKLRVGLEECFSNGIYPVTWETPHYVASENTYRTVGKYFNSSYERVSSVNNAEAGHYFPYPSVDRFGRFIIPENIGFIEVDKPSPEELIKNAERMLVVRDGMASFFFHPFMDLKYLKQSVEGILKLGYHFVSIRDYNLRVQLDDRLVQTKTNSIEMTSHAKYLHRLYQQADGGISGESNLENTPRGVITDPGVVPANAILVMEGADEILALKEQVSPGKWEVFKSWVQSKLHGKTAAVSPLEQPHAVVLWEDNLPKEDWNNQSSYVSALSLYGFRTSTMAWNAFEMDSVPEGAILVVPQAVAVRLPPSSVASILAFVKSGGRLVLDGPSPLSQSLGVQRLKRSIKVRTVDEMLYEPHEITWNPSANVPRFAIPKPIAVYARDVESELPLAVLGGFHEGRFLYLGARFDPVSKLGYTRYPNFIHYLREGFKLNLPAQRKQLELYFDPALAKRQGAEDKLAEQWSRMGVRIIYAAAYQFWPKWSYNYQHLVEVCHRNGILVYAWFEFPHVSVKFWEEHPEWRAKTATGEDGHVGWRYHMDLDIPACRNAVFDFAVDFLNKYEWDGVNIAELNYDTVNGPETPKSYLPMGSTTRSGFLAQYNFDPILLFSPTSPYYWQRNRPALKKFEAYRAQRVLEWHRDLLDRITPVAKARDMEVIVTMLDSLHSRTLKRDTGMDSRLILPLMDRYPFMLQVEDPSHFWAESPDRYQKFTETYLKLVKDRSRLMFDINVVPDRDIEKSHAPTQTVMGVELAQTANAARQASGRVAVYSEGTVPYQDVDALSRVLANDAILEKAGRSWTVESKDAVILNAPGLWQNYQVNGRIWPGWGENSVFMPAGKHQISPIERRFQLMDRSALDMRLLRFSGDMDSLTPTQQGFEFAYDSPLRTIALLNREPHEIQIDGRKTDLQPVAYAGNWNIRLPSGKHRVEIIADSTASTIVNTTSLYSATAIVIFGTVACGLLGLLYMAILLRRTFARAVGDSARS
jgi:uncharacterized protein YdaL